MVDKTQNEIEIKTLISETSIIAILSLIGYLSAVCYQIGILTHFGISPFFVEISLTQTLTTIVLVSVFLIMFSPIVIIFIDLLRKNGYLNGLTLVYLFFMLLTTYLFLLSKAKIEIYVIIMLVFTFQIIFFNLILPLVDGRKIKGFKNKRIETERKLLENQKTNSDSQKDNVFSILFLKLKTILNPIHGTLFICLLIVTALSFTMGLITASTSNRYYTLSTRPERIVIFKEGSNFWTVIYNRRDNSFDANYRIYSIEDLSKNQISMKLEDIKNIKSPEILQGNSQ